MTELQTLVAQAKDEFAKHRVNKAVDNLIKALDLIAQGGAPANMLTEPAPAPAAPIVEQAAAPEQPKETTPADLARVLATQERSETEEPAPKPARKRAPAGTRSSDV